MGHNVLTGVGVVSRSSTTASGACKSFRQVQTGGCTSRYAATRCLQWDTLEPVGMISIRTPQPLAGHAICNIGDTLNIFSGGILRSNIHRVVSVFPFLSSSRPFIQHHDHRPPPKEQAQHERWSLVFFTRPNDTVTLHHLAAHSAQIAAAVALSAAPGKYAPGVTAEEWLMRRVRAQRVTQYKVCSHSCHLACTSCCG